MFRAGGLRISFLFVMFQARFEAVDLFTCYSHRGIVLPAGAFRVEITPAPHKKKSELYFASRPKKTLT